MAAPSRTTAVQKIERSKLDPKSIQREMMLEDTDVTHLRIYLNSVLRLDAATKITDAGISRTIEGASTVDVTVIDSTRQLLRSGLLSNKLDIEIDGLWFRLVQVGKQDNTLTLTFEDREIAILRTYSKLKIVNGRPEKSANRKRVTRAEFVVNLLREVKEYKPIPYVIPELHVSQPIEKVAQLPGQVDTQLNKEAGIPKDINSDPRRDSTRNADAREAAAKAAAGAAKSHQSATSDAAAALTVKGNKADSSQIQIANIVISVGSSMGARRKVLVASIMVAITEASLTNPSGGDGTSVGVFQQTDGNGYGTREERHDPATAARMYFQRAIPNDKADPSAPIFDLTQGVQRSAFPDRYALYRVEAERFVTAFGIPGGDTALDANSANLSIPGYGVGSDYFFYRGDPVDGGKTWKKENSWDCIQRLASEVDWRAFFVSGTFYYISEDDLFKQMPLATIREFDEGIEGINGDYDTNKKSANLSITARVGRWLVPPGSVIILRDMGPWNGRWIVSDYRRSLFDTQATITIKKPRPALPEPAQNNLGDVTSGWPSAPVIPSDPPPGMTGAYVNPLPGNIGASTFMNPDGCEGVLNDVNNVGNICSRDGYPHVHGAVDWFAPGGTPVHAPVGGTLVEVKQSSGNSGQVFGGVVKLQQDNGYVWVFRHVDPAPPLREGARVSQAQVIANVTSWADNPKSSHSHIEIWRTLGGGYKLSNMVDPTLFITGAGA